MKHRVWKNKAERNLPWWNGTCGWCSRCSRWLETGTWQLTFDLLEAHVVNYHGPSGGPRG
jgi:hypothetical protein